MVEGEEQEERCLKNDEDVTVPFRVFHGAFSGVQDWAAIGVEWGIS